LDTQGRVFCGGIWYSVACIEACQNTNTKRSIHPASQSLEQVLIQTRLSLGQNLKSSDCIPFDWLSYQVRFRKKIWNGTFGDACQWFLFGALFPIAGLFVGLTEFGELMPTIGSFMCFSFSFYHIRIQWCDGRWPGGSGGGGGGGCGGGG